MSDSSQPIPTSTPPNTGDVWLGRYRVERAIGRGGMGEVLLAFDQLLDRRVALKRVRPGDDAGELRDTILREARRASQISDRRIASIYDVIEHNNEIVLVMEYVDGVTLRQRMAEPISLPEFWDLATQCVEAIVVAHRHGVIHRDVKPDNLMVTEDGQVKVLDFGLAQRLHANDATRTTLGAVEGKIAGTPQYMAPEAHLGNPIDERTDIFSLGVVFYEMLTSQRPFAGSTYAAVVDKVLNSEPPPVQNFNRAAGAELSALVGKMLAKNPADRFASASVLLQQLQHVRHHSLTRPSATLPTGAVAAASTSIAPKRARRGWLVAMAIMLALAATVWQSWRKLVRPALPADLNVTLVLPEAARQDDEFFLGLGLSELLGKRLRRHTTSPGFQLTLAQDVGDEKVHTAADARTILGANIALLPAIEQGPDVLRARLDLYETEHGRLLATRRVEAAPAQLFGFLDDVYRESAGLLGLVADTESAEVVHGIRGAGTLRFYLQGLGRARAAETGEEAARAVEDFELACRTGPDVGVAHAGLALALFGVYLKTNDPKRLDEAEQVAREATELDPDYAETHRVLGSVLTSQKRTAEAAVSLARACALDPSDDGTLYKLARAYSRLGDTEKEGQTYRDAVAERPHSWKRYWWLATWLFRQGHVEESIEVYKNMVRRAPYLHTGYSSLGGLLVLRGDYEDAIEALQQSIELRPTSVAFQNLGTAFFNSGQFLQAIDAYNQAFQFGFASYESWLNLGDAYYWARGREDQAADAYLQAVRLGREESQKRADQGRAVDVMIPARLASVFPRLGEPDSARAYLQQALAAAGDNPMVFYHAALTHWQLNEKEDALEWLEKSVRNGYPVVWLRDSVVFDEWRQVTAFRKLVDEAESANTTRAN